MKQIFSEISGKPIARNIIEGNELLDRLELRSFFDAPVAVYVTSLPVFRVNAKNGMPVRLAYGIDSLPVSVSSFVIKYDDTLSSMFDTERLDAVILHQMYDELDLQIIRLAGFSYEDGAINGFYKT